MRIDGGLNHIIWSQSDCISRHHHLPTLGNTKRNSLREDPNQGGFNHIIWFQNHFWSLKTKNYKWLISLMKINVRQNSWNGIISHNMRNITGDEVELSFPLSSFLTSSLSKKYDIIFCGDNGKRIQGHSRTFFWKCAIFQDFPGYSRTFKKFKDIQGFSRSVATMSVPM